MALADKFAMAYVFFGLFGLWSIGYWLTSDWLENKRKSLSTRSVRRDPVRFAREARIYCAWEWGVCALIIGIASWFIFWTDQEHRQQVQDETRKGLSVSAGNETNPLKSFFTLVNGSAHDLGEHSMIATPNMIVGNDGTSAVNAQNTRARLGVHFECEGFKDSLNAGNSQTYPCLHNLIMNDPSIQCVDITLNLTYELKKQPRIQKRKDFRFVSSVKDGFAWHPQPSENPFNYCSSYLTEKARRAMQP